MPSSSSVLLNERRRLALHWGVRPNAEDHCEGCYRSAEEITRWIALDDEARGPYFSRRSCACAPRAFYLILPFLRKGHDTASTSSTRGAGLGRPGNPLACRVALCGAGELGKEVAVALQRLGCEVIALDRYAHAPAMQLAHRSHVLPMTDEDQLLTVLRREKPDLIVPEIEAIATSALVTLEGGLYRCPHGPGGAAHHESGRHSAPGGRNAGPTDLALSLR